MYANIDLLAFPFLFVFTCFTHSCEDVDMIVKFAEFEYKIGDPSRGQTLFENVVSNYPKRLDVWSRYFDMSIKQGDRESTRLVLWMLVL